MSEDRREVEAASPQSDREIARAEHDAALSAPQRFPLTGDGLVTQRVIASGPLNGGDIGEELATGRYRDWQHLKADHTQAVEAAQQFWARRAASPAPAANTETVKAAESQSETEILQPRLSL